MTDSLIHAQHPGAAQPTLGVIMIVKNEEKNIGHLLEDIKGIVDEIVVVDTGSTDSTLDILKASGVTIGRFTWCDDFSAARNTSIELASSDYLLWLDADDRIDREAGEAILRFKRSLPADKRHAYMLKLMNTAEKFQDTVSYQLRVFPNIENVRFEGRLHEQIITSLERIPGIRIETVEITILHTGYHTEDDVVAKGKRNLAIQLRELEDGKDTARQNFYIAMSYHAIKDYGKCLEYIQKARVKSEKENWYKYSFNLSTECHVKLNQVEDALKEAKKGSEIFNRSGKMFYNLGAVFMKAGKYKQSVEALQKALQLGMEVDGFPTPPNIRATLHHYLGISFDQLGQRKEAISAYRKTLEVNPHWGPAWKSLGLALIQSGDIDEAIVCLEKAKTETPQFDHSIRMSLAKIYCYKKRYADAHLLYREVVDAIPSHRDALAGLVQTSISVDNVESLLSALDIFMQAFGLDNDREIGSVSELANLCSEIAACLLKQGDTTTAEKLIDASLALDDRCSLAYLVSSDLEMTGGRIPQAVAFLEKAMLSGAQPVEIETRMKDMENRSR